ncbi:MAG: helix-turn-helix domain-containing protein [Candidatus Binatia bacterium]
MAEWQWKRWEAVERVIAGELTGREAAAGLGVSVRQVRRIRRAIERRGRAALQHGNRGRPPANKLAATTCERMVTLRRTTYRDFNDQHFTEKLATEQPPIHVGVATVRRVLRGAKIPAVWQRRPRRHRRRRDRKAQAGLMLLWDGSRHDWLEGRGPWLCLVGAIEDATGELLPGAHFVAQECAAAYLRVLAAIVQTCGIPWSIYMDQHGALQRNDDHWTLAEEQRGRQDPTQVGGALEGLGIEAIYALSAQGPRRTLVGDAAGSLGLGTAARQRLHGGRGEHRAGALLPRAQRAVAVAPQDQQPAWRRLRPGVDLARLCSFRYEATVLKDNTVRLGGTVVLDIPPGPRARSYADRRVEVRQLLDGTWRVYLADRLIATAASVNVILGAFGTDARVGCPENSVVVSTGRYRQADAGTGMLLEVTRLAVSIAVM